MDPVLAVAARALRARRLLVAGVGAFPDDPAAEADRARFLADRSIARSIALGNLAGALGVVANGLRDHGQLEAADAASAWAHRVIAEFFGKAPKGAYTGGQLRPDFNALRAAVKGGDTDFLSWWSGIVPQLIEAANEFARWSRRDEHAPVTDSVIHWATGVLATLSPAERDVAEHRIRAAIVALDDGIRAVLGAGGIPVDPFDADYDPVVVEAQYPGIEILRAIVPPPPPPDVAHRWTTAPGGFDLTNTEVVGERDVEGYGRFRRVAIPASSLDAQLVAYGTAAQADPNVFVATDEEFSAWAPAAPEVKAEVEVEAPEAEPSKTAVYAADSEGRVYIDGAVLTHIDGVVPDPGGGATVWVGAPGVDWHGLAPADVRIAGAPPDAVVYRIDGPDIGALVGYWYTRGWAAPSTTQAVLVGTAAHGVAVEPPSPPEGALDLAALLAADHPFLKAISPAVGAVVGAADADVVFVDPDAWIVSWSGEYGTVRLLFVPAAEGEAIGIKTSVSLSALGFDYTHEAETTLSALTGATVDEAMPVLFGETLSAAEQMIAATRGDAAAAAAAKVSAQLATEAAQLDPEVGITVRARFDLDRRLDPTLTGAYAVAGRALPFTKPRTV